MSIIRWRRPESLPTVFDEIDRAVDDFLRYPLRRAVYHDAVEFGPAVDVYQTEDEVVVKAELPGAKREDITLTLEEGGLVLAGSTSHEEETTEEGYYRKEIRRGQFRRFISLPAPVKAEEMTATFDNGVLTVRGPKASEDKGKKIEVK
ncbi:MAG: Hsp20/alpha crystallin family protein [Armatimonadia bacterium]